MEPSPTRQPEYHDPGRRSAIAIDDQPDLRCWSTRHLDSTRRPPAVAVVRGDTVGVNAWFPRCQECVDQLAELADTFVLVAYLDPTRQRRPQSDHDDPTVAGTYFLEPDPDDDPGQP